MSDDDLERLLAQAFDARARVDVPDRRPVPPMRMPDHLSPHGSTDGHRHRASAARTRRLAPVAAAAVVLLVVGIVVALSGNGPSPGRRGAVGPPTGRATHPRLPSAVSSVPSATASPTSRTASEPVHLSLKFGDGQRLGVGMPIIAFLSRPIKDARAFAEATTVTVNGRPVHGAWYFERRSGDPGHPVEADYRLASYWPGHSTIRMSLPAKGLSAGPGLAFDNSLSLDFSTGMSRIVTVDDSTHRLTVLADGQKWGTFPVSLGGSDTRTRRGTKVIMDKGRSICMSGPAYSECGVKYTQRLTYDGEYLHSAPWNISNIDHGIDSSNGCTNLLPGDARKLFGFLGVGDPVRFPNADGPLMRPGDGYGDWNVPWPAWRRGGLYRTS